MDKNIRICIVGGGPAGLSAGMYLEKKGYENYTIPERLDRVGGKCWSPTYNGRRYEMGAIMGVPSYYAVHDVEEFCGITHDGPKLNRNYKNSKGNVIEPFEPKKNILKIPRLLKMKKQVKKLALMITDNIPRKLPGGMKENHMDFWILDRLLTKDEVKFMLSFEKRRTGRTTQWQAEKNGISEEAAQKIIDHLVWIGIVEQNRDNPDQHIQYCIPKWVVGSGEYMVEHKTLPDEHPEVATMFNLAPQEPLEMAAKLVPIVGAAFFHRKTGLWTWLCLVIGGAGLYFLSITETFTLEKGDTLVLLCALVFTLQILLVDKFAPEFDALTLCSIEFLTAGLLSFLPMAVFEGFGFENIRPALWCILYCGIFSCGIAYWLQIVGQRHLPPALASLIMSFESMFGAFFGALLLHERMTGRELLGCGLIFVALVLSQVQPKGKVSTA